MYRKNFAGLPTTKPSLLGESDAAAAAAAADDDDADADDDDNDDDGNTMQLCHSDNKKNNRLTMLNTETKL